LVDLKKSQTIHRNDVLYQCGWSPLEGETLNATVTHTWVSGHLAYENGSFNESHHGHRLLFDRN
jgi:dihydroorotase